jgi:hypothetical protein
MKVHEGHSDAKADSDAVAGIYDPLPQGDYLRLIVLYPGNNDDAIECELEARTHRRAKDKYAAISYVWGDPRDTVDITCNQRIVPITRSLQGALRQFRHPRTIRRLWADALCINQGDLAEKSEQVKNMGRVYRNAMKVLVWLGDDTESIALEVFKMITEINVYCGELFVQYGRLYASMPRLENPHPIPVNKAPWMQLSKLLYLPWFRRAWTVQECALAKDCRMFWGACDIDIADVFEISTWCSYYKDLRWLVFGHGFEDFHRPVGHFQSIHCRYRGRDRWQESRPGLRYEASYWALSTFGTVLRAGSRLEATDPRDHVFAFLACSLGQTEDNQPIINANYLLSEEELWYQVACNLIRHTSEGPWLLSTVKHENRAVISNTNRPSWVTYWSESVGRTFLGARNYTFLAGGSPDRFEATLRQGSTLEVVGSVFDSVTWISTPFQDGNFTLGRFQDPNTSTHEDPAIDRFWKETSVAAESLGCKIDQETFGMALLTPGCFESDTLEVYQKMFSVYCRVARRECKGVDPTKEETAADADDDIYALQAMRYLTWSTGEKCLFLTREGRIGLCSAAVMAVGDLCCILAGAPVPFLLTPATNQRHKLVEECYIYGVMHGELLEECGFGSIFLE